MYKVAISGSKATQKKSLFPVQRVAKIVASRAAAKKKIMKIVKIILKKKKLIKKKKRFPVGPLYIHSHPAAGPETTFFFRLA